MIQSGFLKKTFAAVLLAGAITPAFGFFPAGAAGHHGTEQSEPEPAITQSIKHPDLASDSTEPVGAQLILAMDNSSSMKDDEFEIQLHATAHGLNSELFRNAIKYKSGDNSVAIAVIQFDSKAKPRIPWVDIRGDEINDKPYQPDPVTGLINPEKSSYAPDKLDALAREIASLPRLGSGGTEFEPAMRLSYELFSHAPWQVTERRILDIFSDGREWGYDKEKAQLVSLGVTINAFAILNETPDLDEQYREGDQDHGTILVTQKYVESADGIYSEPGRVWAVARSMEGCNVENNTTSLCAFFDDVAEGMKQKITVEVAGLDNYRYARELLGRDPLIPVPEPTFQSIDYRPE